MSAKAVKAFLQAAIGPGQVDLDKNGYIPLPPDFQARVSTAVDAISSRRQRPVRARRQVFFGAFDPVVATRRREQGHGGDQRYQHP